MSRTRNRIKRVFTRNSEKHPSRADLTVLVAHNDDPTGAAVA